MDSRLQNLFVAATVALLASGVLFWNLRREENRNAPEFIPALDEAKLEVDLDDNRVTYAIAKFEESDGERVVPGILNGVGVYPRVEILAIDAPSATALEFGYRSSDKSTTFLRVESSEIGKTLGLVQNRGRSAERQRFFLVVRMYRQLNDATGAEVGTLLGLISACIVPCDREEFRAVQGMFECEFAAATATGNTFHGAVGLNSWRSHSDIGQWLIPTESVDVNEWYEIGGWSRSGSDCRVCVRVTNGPK